MKNKRSFLIVCFMVLIISFIIQTNNVYAIEQNRINDYSSSSSLSTYDYVTINFLNDNLNAKLIDSEIEYLKDEDIILSYENKIPTTNVTTSIDGNILLVKANEYSYIDKNNNEIIWIPSYVKLGSNTKEFVKESDYYECIFDTLTLTDESIDVYYESNFVVSKESINSIINKAYNEAEYYVTNNIIETRNQTYLNNKTLYEKYLIELDEYNKNIEKYNEYLDLKAKYDEDYKKYQKYLSDYNAYLEEQALYNEYLNKKNEYDSNLIKYQTYLNELDEYNKNKEANEIAYQEYIAKKEKADYKVNAVKLISLEMTDLKRSIYGAIMGSTVTTVLSRTEDLEQLNADSEAIDFAEEATIALRTMFSDISKLENDEDYFSYYCQNYTKLKTNLEKLLKSLDKLYRSGWVAKAIEQGTTKENNYKEKYIILICQLAFICNVIDDSDIYNYEAQKPGVKNPNMSAINGCIIDSSWTIDGRTMKQVLGDIVDIVDMDSNNGSTSKYATYPEKVELLVAPTEVTKPIEPEKVNEPVAPTEVVEPSKIEEVEKPIKPTEVKEPILEETPEVIKQLVEDYNNNLLVRRDELTKDYIYKATSIMNKQIRDLTKVTIEFYDNEGNFLSKEVTDKGSYITYNGTLPSKAPDEKYQEYKFVGWAYKDNTKLDLNNVTKDGYVYPIFEGVLRTFTVTWIVEGVETSEIYEYGSIPEYKYEIKKENSDSKYYLFASWDKDITKVTSDITYNALFNSFYLIETKNGYAEIIKDEDNLIINNVDNEINISSLIKYEDDINNYNLIINNDNYKSIINKIDAKQLMIANIDSIKLNLITNEDYSEYSIKFIKDQEKVNLNIEVDIEIIGNFDVTHASLCVKEDSKIKKLRASISNDKISFTMNSNLTYLVYNFYTINVLTSDFTTITVDKTEAISGEEISISFGEIKQGVKLNKIYAVDSNGNQIDINTDSYTIALPNCDIYIGAQFSYIQYIIRFLVDDVVISSKMYKYNDEVIPPSNPIKVSDEEYSYTFIGWDTEITKVNDDKDYNALFEKQKIEIEIIPKKVSIIKIVKISLIIILACVVAFIGIKIYKKRYKKIS